jgi:hypothetical protein
MAEVVGGSYQRVKVRDAVFILDGDLAVDDRRAAVSQARVMLG